jgi:hypothetical protein
MNRYSDALMSASRSRRSLGPRIGVAILAACAAALLSGCGSMIGEHLPAAVGGEPAAAPPPPATPVAYPAVHNMPPARSTSPLDNVQQKQLEDDLVAARNRYGGNPDAATTADPKAGGARNP